MRVFETLLLTKVSLLRIIYTRSFNTNFFRESNEASPSPFLIALPSDCGTGLFVKGKACAFFISLEEVLRDPQ